MRNLLLISTAILMLNTANIKAQITLDQIVSPKSGIGSDFYTAQISSTETKYVFLDTLTNTFSLYNMDFTPFLLNISVPEPFANFTFQPVYITRSLFDCDTSNIEYAYDATGGSSNNPFYIMRTDGTQLFYLDSANGPFCLGGCLGMSDIIVPIRNTSDGTKLFLQRPTSAKIHIYSLCGSLPVTLFDLTPLNQNFVSIFPNPASGSLTFQITLPDNINDYELVIHDGNSKETRRERINFGNGTRSIDVSNLTSGAYYYSLCTKTKAYQSGKFIVTK